MKVGGNVSKGRTVRNGTAGLALIVAVCWLTQCTAPSFKRGRLLYETACSQCHGIHGEGLGELMPPLENADYLRLYPDSIPCLIRRGYTGAMMVNGKIYDLQDMPPHPDLSDIDIVNIVNYIHNAFGNAGWYLTPERADSLLSRCR